MEIDELEKAHEYLSGCLEYSALPPPIKSIIRSNLAEVLGRMGRDEEALSFLEEAASISMANKVGNLEVSQPIRLGMKYIELNRVDEADSMKAIIQNIPGPKFRAEFSINKWIFNSKLALSKGDYQESLNHANQAIQIAEKRGIQSQLKDIYAVKSRAFEAMGELESSLENMRLQDELEKTIRDRRQERDLSMMKVRYRLQNKEEQLSEVSAEL